MAHVPKSGEESAAGGKARQEKAGQKSRPAAPDPPERVESAAVPGSRAAARQDEADLIRRAQGGDTDAYEELLHAHQQRVFAIVGGILRRREDIEDVAQQVFIKVYVSLKQFDLRSTFSTWLYKITVNECYDYLRKKRVRKLVYEADLSEEQVRQLEAFESGAGLTPPDAAQRAELRQTVGRLLGELSEEDRMMLVLKEVEGFSVEEIGRVLDINVNTVKVRLFRARGRLVDVYRKRLKERRR
jgi:RNA polymerase sigma-70 factor (ECF subfamily)